MYRAYQFQSTLPARGATPLSDCAAALADISIHTPREGSDRIAAIKVCGFHEISIHTPREGSDLAGALKILLLIISIHTPREGSDHIDNAM